MRILSVLSIELLAFAVIELLVRASVGLGLVSLPSMSVGWFDRLQQGEDPPVEKRLYEADRDLIFRMRANADLVYPRTVLQPNKPQTWAVHTNEHGFRSPSFSEAKPAGVFRIICLGDSSTFGMNVNDADAYPQVLARLLEERAPGRFEVLNLGVPGYSSRQGLELLRQSVLRYQPDLVTFAFGTNDRFWRRAMSDDQVIRFNQSISGALVMYARNAAEHLYTYRLLRRLAATTAWRLFGTPLQAGEPLVSLAELAGNVATANALLGANGAPMLVLNNDFYGTDAIAGMRDGARQAGAPVLDMRQLFANRERQRTRELEAQYHLSPPETPKGLMLFRVRTLAPEQLVAVDVRPGAEAKATRFPMRDDGRSGDQVADDGIWSSWVPAGQVPMTEYVYWKRNGVDFVREYGETVTGTSMRLRRVASADNIDTLGEPYLHTDSAHPDEEGHGLIAKALVEQVLQIAPSR